MEHLLPHEVAERELEMQEAAEIEERREEELRVAEVEVEKNLSVEDSVVEYQCKLSRSHYYGYYNLEGGTRMRMRTRTRTLSTSAGGRGVHQRQHVTRSSHRCLISHRRCIGGASADLLKLCVLRLCF